MPADFNPTNPGDTAPPSQIDVFAGELHWADVTVPEGVDVIGQRLAAHGFSAADGVVIEGKVTDLVWGLRGQAKYGSKKGRRNSWPHGVDWS
jgi:hypothetical protein